MGRFVLNGGWVEKDMIARWRTRALLRTAFIVATLSLLAWSQALPADGQWTSSVLNWLAAIGAVASLCLGIGACIGWFIESPSLRRKVVDRDGGKDGRLQ
jgi:hypothetical protein